MGVRRIKGSSKNVVVKVNDVIIEMMGNNAPTIRSVACECRANNNRSNVYRGHKGRADPASKECEEWGCACRTYLNGTM